MIGFGEVTDSELEITYDSNADIAGFQFTVSGLTLLEADGGAAAEAGFTVSVGSTTGIVIGFAFDGFHTCRCRYINKIDGMESRC